MSQNRVTEGVGAICVADAVWGDVAVPSHPCNGGRWELSPPLTSGDTWGLKHRQPVNSSAGPISHLIKRYPPTYFSLCLCKCLLSVHFVTPAPASLLLNEFRKTKTPRRNIRTSANYFCPNSRLGVSYGALAHSHSSLFSSLPINGEKKQTLVFSPDQ